MGTIHNLLKRQIRRHFGDAAPAIPEWDSFLKFVNDAYCEFEADRKMLERALELSSQELLESNSQLRGILEAFPDVFLILNSEGIIIDLKTGSTTELHIPPEQLVGKHLDELNPHNIDLPFTKAVEKTLKTRVITRIEYSIIKNRLEQFYEARLLPIPDDHIFVIIRNITDRKLMEDKLVYLSMHDSLTGLYNRNYFKLEFNRLEKLTNLQVALIICDIDGLKLINDTLGHDAGDTLLIQAAQIIKSTLRQSDFVSRIGGDEFAIILYECSQKGVESFLNKINENIIKFNSGDSAVPLSISMGSAVRNDPSKTMEELFKEADDNMYRQKLFHRRSSLNNLINTMMNTLSERDFINQGHTDRLQKLVYMMGKSLNMPRNKLAELKLLAQFHDIGKVGISDSILFKNGPLNPSERTEIERHAEIGYRIACSSPLLMPISDWILKHHEWWNGKGYPCGINGEDIPIESRILALADAYDAMTNERPYRKAMTHDEAIQEIKDNAGKQFDPELTDLFIAQINKS
ncbi:MAG: HD domain-containing phosphohydrolase [Syntrophomonadaceae bacterium]